LPGMSGFASEIAVFIGMSTSEIYSSTFRAVTIGLAAIGLILTPIYLLSMLRQLFYGTATPLTCNVGQAEAPLGSVQEEAVCFGNSCVLPSQAVFSDVKPRELFIAASFLVLIIGIGMYPKFTTQVYDAKTVALNRQMQQAYQRFAQSKPQATYAQKVFAAPEIAGVVVQAVAID
ncbi:MAG: NAD(P)H-quinone oxidoreductase subunit 4, partial [Synechococcales bacterium]|nr:NAD(P)H-quinone oxidoreductase subunit 4 [Synechococcales bacterium]